MTVQAAEYYCKAARDLVTDSPAIFNGKVRSLMPDGHQDGQVSCIASSWLGEQVRANFEATLSSVLPYVTPNADPSHYDAVVNRNNQSHITNLIGATLLPRKMRAGKLFNIAIEAIAPKELSPPMVSALYPSTYPGFKNLANRPVFFVLTALFKTVYTPEQRAAMAVVFAEEANHSRRLTPRFVTGRLPQYAIREWYEPRG